MTRKIGIDIGSLSVRTVLYGDGADITESPAVYSSVGGTVAGIGSAAVRMNSGVPGAVTVLPFIPAGDELPDPDAAYTLFSGILHGYRIKKADIWLSLPADCGEETERLFVETAQQAGARDVFSVSAGYAAALGSGVRGAGDSLTLHIGARCSSLIAFSKGQKIASSVTEFAGDAFDRAIGSYLLKKYRVTATPAELRRIKHEVGSLNPSDDSMKAKVMRAAFGLPKEIKLTENEISAAIEPVFDELADAVIALIRTLPCEPDRIILTGGGAEMTGIAPAMAPLVGIPVTVAEKPGLAVARGLISSMTSEE